MTVTREELAAFADGQLEPERQQEIAKAVAADPSLAAEVEAHRALKAKLGTHFAPILADPIPEKLTAMLTADRSNVIDFSERREGRSRRWVRWSWVAGPALAASLALAIFLPRDDSYAKGPLATALETQLVAEQSGKEPTRILLTFRDGEGSYCRAFAGSEESGIACRDAKGWRLRTQGEPASAQQGDYRMAAAPASSVLEAAQSLAVGAGLTAVEEKAVRQRHWR
jgi:hypothetical protein